MCIIIGGLKKNLKEQEQLQGMKSNNHGFSICVIRKKGKAVDIKVTRSLKQDDIMKVWRKAKNDDYVVTHSRIPSCGGLTANMDDVHGWQREGVTFFHNGTMSNIKNIMGKEDKRTDSLYFFEEIFIPLYVSRGRVFDEVLEKTCDAIADGSRFCFVLPDGTVKYFGNYVHDHDCVFSNRSYEVPKVYGTTGYGYGYGCGYSGHQKGTFGGFATRDKFCGEPYDDEEAYASWWHKEDPAKPAKSDPETATQVVEPSEDDIPTATQLVGGIKHIVPLMLQRIAYQNVLSLMVDEASGNSKELYSHLDSRMSQGDYNLTSSDDFLLKAPFELDRIMTKDDILGVVEDYADELIGDLEEDGISSTYLTESSYTDSAITTLKEYLKYTTADAHMVNLMFNWTETNKIGLTGLATAFKVTVSDTTNVPYMEHRTMTSIWTTYVNDAKTGPVNIALENLRLLYKIYEEECKKKEAA